MANQEQLDILKQGVDVWNRWREKHPEIKPDLRNADLFGAILKDANFTGADLRRAFLIDTNFTNSNLQDADLARADFFDATLIATNFTRADLTGTSLRGAKIKYANFNQAKLGWTIFGDVDLHLAKGLETAIHIGPSTIGIDTIFRSGGNVSKEFLRGAGVPDTWIAHAHSLIGKTIDFYSCFISYSSRDEIFTKRLHADLQNNDVRCWFAPDDLKWGDKIRPRIDESIRLYDKLLLVLSEHSVTSQWVEQEVETALERERQENRVILFPIRLDDSVMELKEGWPALVRHTRNIGNFISWQHPQVYDYAMQHLLSDLRRDSPLKSLPFGSDITKLSIPYLPAHLSEVSKLTFPWLSEREREILYLLAQGMTNAQIATLLEVSEKTVKNYLSMMFEKLQVRDRAKLIALAREAFDTIF